jgi:hypothetical protein
MAVQGGNLAVESHGGFIRILDGSGKSLALKNAGPVTSPEAPSAAKALAAKACPLDRIVKVVAEGADRVAVGCWGGTLLLLDRTGAPKARTQMPQDITAIAWLKNLLVVGLADGRVVALSE